jgi:hypothetical protein
VRRTLDDPQVPVSLERAQLGCAQEAERAALGERLARALAVDGKRQDLPDGAGALVRVARGTPVRDARCQRLVELRHPLPTLTRVSVAQRRRDGTVGDANASSNVAIQSQRA